jgi:hypothetical protein
MKRTIVAIAAASAIFSASAQYESGYSQAVLDAAQIDLMKSQAKLYGAHADCLRAASEQQPCSPPQRPDMTPSSPAQYRGGYGQGMLDSARRDLMRAQARAFNAYGQCIKAKGPGSCGPSP